MRGVRQFFFIWLLRVEVEVQSLCFFFGIVSSSLLPLSVSYLGGEKLHLEENFRIYMHTHPYLEETVGKLRAAREEAAEADEAEEAEAVRRGERPQRDEDVNFYVNSLQMIGA